MAGISGESRPPGFIARRPGLHRGVVGRVVSPSLRPLGPAQEPFLRPAAVAGARAPVTST
jgi:hypothetical protein